MYTPEYYKIEDENVIYEVISQNSFALLISNNSGKLTATHVPVLLEKDANDVYYLFGHISSANLQYKDINPDVLIIFQGPHQYISSTWYETDQSVPTWNYVAVHAYGTIEFTKDREKTIEILKKTISYFETEGSSYNMDSLEGDYFEKLLKGIIAFEVRIEKLEGKWKLSQNHTRERQERVIKELENSGDENSTAIADLMKAQLNKKQ